MFKLLLLSVLLMLSLSNCTIVHIDAGEEAVIVDKPVIFGHGGMREDVYNTGSTITWFSVSKYHYTNQPYTVKEHFEDMATKDRTPVDLDLYLTVQMPKGKSTVLHEKFGKAWYSKNARAQVRAIGRDEIRKYTLDELRVNTNVTKAIQDTIINNVTKYLTAHSIPINILRVNLGKAVPPDAVLKEAANTAAQKQRVKTQKARVAAETQRKAAERMAAIADKAYSREFNMTTQQFLTNKWLDIIKDKESVQIVTGGTIPTLSVK